MKKRIPHILIAILLFGCTSNFDDSIQKSNEELNISSQKKTLATGEEPQVRYDDLPDFNEVSSPFVVQGNKWSKTNLTYYFQSGTIDINGDQEQQAFKDAFALWAAVTPLTFTQVGTAAAADIIILFGAGNHGDPYPFDGVGSVLAHAFYPPPNGNFAGDAHFDDDETWTLNFRSDAANPRDLVTVAAHEIGHSLGLNHSQNVNALMYPYYSGSHRSLDLDDIQGIQSIYGTSDIMAIQRWATQQGGFWNTQQWVAGDFNGDGKEDFAKSFNDNGLATIDVHLSNGSGFSIQRWATQQGGFWDTQKWIAGDFNGDGKTDLANVFNDGGQATIDVHPSTGSSFGIERWATQQGGFWDTQKWIAGDFTGDGKADLANIFNDGGQATIDIHPSNGSDFGIQRWATQQGGFWDAQKWIAGDFTGDGKFDLANAFNDDGLATIDVHPSNGSNFGIQRWATKQGGFWNTQQWVAGDFTGDGKTDLAKAFNGNGLASIDVHPSNGSGFDIQRWATNQGGFWDAQKWVAGDFTGDGKDDIAKAFNDGGLASIDVHVKK